jgi:hypothetical protein
MDQTTVEPSETGPGNRLLGRDRIGRWAFRLAWSLWLCWRVLS